MRLTYRKKTCTKCKRYLWLRDFYKLSNLKDHPDGYDCRCKDCRREEKRQEYARKRKVPDGIRRNGRGMVVEKKGYSSRLYWGELKVADFKRLFPYNTNEDVAVDMGCSVRTVVRRAREMGLEKDPEWLHRKWDLNRRLAHGVNKICGNQANLTNFIEGGKAHRFLPGRKDESTAEERHQRMLKAWETRRRNVKRTNVSL